MARIKSISNVGIFVSNQKRAQDFYTKKLGMKVVGGMPEWGYVELAVKKGGKDAVLNLWTPKAWGLSAAEAKKRVGGITGIALGTSDFEGTVAALRKKRVKVDAWREAEDWEMATVYDPDGNGLFITPTHKKSPKRKGITGLEWVTISTRNARTAGKFFQNVMGMKKAGDEWSVYRVGNQGTSLMPFTPNPKNYENKRDYKNDMAAIGEDTAIMFATDDAFAMEKAMKAKGAKFDEPVKQQDWGGISGNFKDPSGNIYMLFQPRKR